MAVSSERTDFYYRCPKCHNAVSAAVFSKVGPLKCYRTACPSRNNESRMERIVIR